MKNRLVQKAITLAITMAVLMLGLMLISDVVRDRIHHRNRAMQSVVNSTAGEQTLFGPVLVQQCTRELTSKDSEGRAETRVIGFQRYALPDEVRHNAHAQMQPRTRGLYQVNTFVLADKISARFVPGNQLQGKPDVPGLRQCDTPRMMLPLSDPRGLRTAALRINDKEVAMESGTSHPSYARGLQSKAITHGNADSPMEVVLALELIGTERVGFVPVGGSNEVSIKADWPHPSFGGNFLPSRRAITDSSFDANWSISALASSARQGFLGGKPLCSPVDPDAGYAQETSNCLEQFGTSFIDPVNPYTLSDRATKYGLLFIVLTFVAVAMFEVSKKLRIHPVQYLLVGSALCIFFLLLISLSEHIGFEHAYAVGAAACVLLLGYYATYILGSIRRGLPFATLIAVMYGLLFVLLQLEQTALAVGSLAMFSVLALLMVITRHVDWYAFGKGDNTPAPKAPAPSFSTPLFTPPLSQEAP